MTYVRSFQFNSTEDLVNLVTLLGAAVGSEEFCKLFFANAERAAALLNLTLTQAEVHQLRELRETFTEEKSEKLCGLLAEIRSVICPNRWCAFEVVIPGGKPEPGIKAA